MYTPRALNADTANPITAKLTTATTVSVTTVLQLKIRDISLIQVEL